MLHRLVAAAPCIREQFWSLSKYVLGQLNAILKARGHPKVIYFKEIHKNNVLIKLYKFLF